MSIRRNDEAQRLWELILQAERMPVKTEEDFQAKKRELAKLRDAYEKVTGLSGNPNDMDAQQARADHALFRDVLGRGPQHPTKDDL